MERRHAPDARDATGKLIAACYCRACRPEVTIEEREAAAREEDTPPALAHEAGQRSPL